MHEIFTHTFLLIEKPNRMHERCLYLTQISIIQTKAVMLSLNKSRLNSFVEWRYSIKMCLNYVYAAIETKCFFRR